MKKILATILAVCMMLSVLVVAPVSADTGTIGYVAPTPTVTKGTYPNLASLTDAPTSGTYEIYNAEGLSKLGQLVCTGKKLEGVTIYQTADIDMSSVLNFQGIGATAGHVYLGTFDGQGYKIMNLTQKKAANDVRGGLFSLLMSGSVIRNVYLDETCLFTYESDTGNMAGFGSLAGQIHGTCVIQNCYSAAKVVNNANDSHSYIGGMIGKLESPDNLGTPTLEGLTFAGEVFSARCAGGILGLAYAASPANGPDNVLTMTNCLNAGSVTTDCPSGEGVVDAAGGIIGRSWMVVIVDGCQNTGDITSKMNTTAGAIIGQQAAKSGTIVKNCKASGTLTGSKLGLIGNASSVTVDVSENNVDECERQTFQIEGDEFVPDQYGVGYSDERITKVDLTNVPNILEIDNYLVHPEAYKITNAQGLVDLADYVNFGDTFKNVTIYLANDIDMSSVEKFIPIGLNGSFQGTFDGQGYIIDNLMIDAANWVDLTANVNTAIVVGLFGITAGEAVIKNTILGENCEIKAECAMIETNTVQYRDSRIGAFIGNIGGKSMIDNCYNMATVIGGKYVGGIVGFTGSAQINVIQNCTNAGEISTVMVKNADAGGILGIHAAAGTRVYNCRNIGEVSVAGGGDIATAVGGIVSRSWDNDLVIQNCINNGDVDGGVATSVAGGIIGGLQAVNSSVNTTKIVDCTNYGEITADKTGEGVNAGLIGTIVFASTAKVELTLTNGVDKAGETDSTLEDAIVDREPVFPEPDPDTPDTPVNPPVTDEPATNAPVTNAPTTNAPTTDAPTTNAPTTNAPSTETPKTKGCGSAIGGVMVVLVAAGAALTVCRKKED